MLRGNEQMARLLRLLTIVLACLLGVGAFRIDHIRGQRINLIPSGFNGDPLGEHMSFSLFRTHANTRTHGLDVTQEEDNLLLPTPNSIGSSIENSPTLVLNADYQPLSHIPLSLWGWQDALRSVFNGKAVIVSEYKDIVVRSVSCSFNLPSVIALKRYHKKPNMVPMMTRRYVFIRDGFKCQYCGEQRPVAQLSLDHVIPRCRGGKLTWTNTVCACQECNYKKGHTMPEDLKSMGMQLIARPREPSYSEIQFKGRALKRTKLHPHWESFM